MNNKIEEKIDSLFEEIFENRQEKRKKAIKEFMDYTGEKNEITATTIVIENDAWLMINVRKYLMSAGIKIYCVQMKCSDGNTAIHPKFTSTLEEAIKIAEKIQLEDESHEFTEVQADLLFKT